MKKLAVLINSMNGGGAERVASILLTDFVAKYEVFLLVLHPGCAFKVPEAVKVHHLGNAALNASNFSKAIRLFFFGYRYFLFCKKNKIDISLSFLNRANYINLISKIFGIKSKVIISERVATEEAYPATSLKGKVSRLFIKILYPYADAIIAISNGVGIDLVNTFKISSKKITTIYNPIDLEVFPPFSKEQRGIESNPFTFIAIGRMDDQKNYALLLEAFAMLSHKADAKLIILGDGFLRKELVLLAHRLGIREKVCMLGFVEDIYFYLMASDCFVLSSNYEGFGNVILEALACGKPVISTDCKHGPGEILAEKAFPVIENGKYLFEKYGVLTPLNDHHEFAAAMQEIITNSVYREAYELSGPQRADKFNKTYIFSQYLNILESKHI